MKAVVLIVSLFWIKTAVTSNRPQPIYTNQFAVHVPKGKEYADAIAERHGFINIGQVSGKFASYFFSFKYYKFEMRNKLVRGTSV